MQIRPLKLAGTYELLLEPKRDERGYFMRAYDEAIFRTYGLTTSWVQENQAVSARKGVVRGLHFQKPPSAETKLVRVVLGGVLDVFVDLRRNSKTYGQWDMIELSAHIPQAIYIPKGFAHGYYTLTQESIVLYKVDSWYAPESEGGIRWDDTDLNIPWPAENPVVSPKDANWPRFRDFVSPFVE